MRKHKRKDAVELDIIIDLATIAPNTTVADLQNIAERNRLYKAYYKESSLTEAGWCNAMCISDSRHAAYLGLTTPAPNSILNKAKKVSQRIRRNIQAVHNMGL